MLRHQLTEVVVDGDLPERCLSVVQRLTGIVDPAAGQRDVRLFEIDPRRRGGFDRPCVIAVEDLRQAPQGVAWLGVPRREPGTGEGDGQHRRRCRDGNQQAAPALTMPAALRHGGGLDRGDRGVRVNEIRERLAVDVAAPGEQQGIELLIPEPVGDLGIGASQRVQKGVVGLHGRQVCGEIRLRGRRPVAERRHGEFGETPVEVMSFAIGHSDHLLGGQYLAEPRECTVLGNPDCSRGRSHGVGGLFGGQTHNHAQDHDLSLLFGQNLQQQ